MKFVTIGLGRMGTLVAQTAVNAGMEQSGGFDVTNIDLLSRCEPVDILLDFSNPASLPAIADYAAHTGCAVLSGTTGFSDADMAVLKKLGETNAVLYSANYSLGIAVFAHLLPQVKAALGDGFDIELTETHHNQKIDAPSGTAKLLLSALDPDGEYKYVYGREGNCGKRTQKEIGVHSLRGGTVAGIHTVSFFGGDETVTITHEASSRRIFADGAVSAAKKLCGMEKGFYTLDEVLFGE